MFLGDSFVGFKVFPLDLTDSWLGFKALPLDLADSCLGSLDLARSCLGFKRLFARRACICMGFKGYHLKTRAYSMQVVPPTFKTRVNTRNCLLVLL